MTKNLAAIGIVLLATVSAYASDWRMVERGTHTSVSVDVASITRKGPIAQIWATTVHTPPLTYADRARPVKSITARWIFNCIDQTHAFGTTVEFDARGRELYSGPGHAPGFQEVVPDSIGEAVMQIACSTH